MQHGSSRERLAGSATRVLAIFGFIAILVVGVWGSLVVARSIPNALSSIASAFVSISTIFVPSDEVLTVQTATLIVPSGAPATVSYVHETKSVDGAYSFSYSCADGVSMAVLGVEEAAVACGERFTLTSAINAFTVRPVSEVNRFADVELSVAFTPTGAGTPTVTGSTLITVENQSLTKSPTVTSSVPPQTQPTAPTPRVPSTPITVQIPVQKPSDPNGYVDLVPRVIEIGTVDSVGAFTASTTPNRRARVAVRFAIENLGTKSSHEFTFNAVLPTYPPYTYFSTVQPVLNPGDRIEYTIGFDSTSDADSVQFLVNVDPSNSINERNKDNNILRYTIYVTR